ncbi:MAG: helix-turn-helix transcriptional regulator [Verrucomicrobiota bacterium]
MANISPSHFFAVFKRQTGFAPLDFFIRLRMQRACELLGTTSLSVKEVAAELGYDDPFYFSRVFKTVSGIAPTDYRRLPESARRECRGRVWLGAEASCVN